MANIKEGDVLVSVNGATDIESIMSNIFSSLTLKLELIRGPHVPKRPSAQCGASTSEKTEPEESRSRVEECKVGDGGVESDQHLKKLRDMDLADKRKVTAGMGQGDLSQLIAERLARSRRDHK